MEKINKVLTFLNLVDTNGNLSITNLAVVITLIKLATSPSANITEAGTLLIALGNYALKRQVIASSAKADDDTESKINNALQATADKLNNLESALTGVALKVGLK